MTRDKTATGAKQGPQEVTDDRQPGHLRGPRTVRMVGEIRAGHDSEWAAMAPGRGVAGGGLDRDAAQLVPARRPMRGSVPGSLLRSRRSCGG